MMDRHFDPAQIPQYAAVMTVLGYCYHVADFTEIYPYLADGVVSSSFWRWNDIVGKDEVIRYYEDKAEGMRRDNEYPSFTVVQLGEPEGVECRSAEGGRTRLMIWETVGKPCLLLHEIDNASRMIHALIIPSFDKDGKLERISISDPALFTFHRYDFEKGEASC